MLGRAIADHTSERRIYRIAANFQEGTFIDRGMLSNHTVVIKLQNNFLTDLLAPQI